MTSTAGRVVRIANSFVFKEPVFNYSGEFPFLWDEITVPVKYGSDLRLARTLLEKIAERHLRGGGRGGGRRLGRHGQAVSHRGCAARALVTLVANDNWIEFTVRYVVDYKARRLTKDRLVHAGARGDRCHGGRVAMASATFHLVEAPTIQVQLKP